MSEETYYDEKTKFIRRVPSSEYQFALCSQSACNASGLIHHLAHTIDLILEEARANNLGTDYVNSHPIVRLYAEQLLFLSGGGSGDVKSWTAANELCKHRAQKETT